MAKRRSHLFAWIALVVFAAFLAISGQLIWDALQVVHAPRDPGVCWRMGKDSGLSVVFRGSTGIEACAGDLERIHMKTGQEVTGAYQGRYIFIDDEAIRSSDTLTGPRWRLYFDNQRKSLDKDLNAHDMTFSTQR